MNIIRIILNVLPEKQKEVMLTLLSLSDHPGKAKGCLNYSIFCDIENGNIFNLISEWKTRRHLNRHVKSDRFSILLGTKSLLSEPMQIQIFTGTDSDGIEAVNSIRKNMKPIFPKAGRKSVEDRESDFIRQGNRAFEKEDA